MLLATPKVNVLLVLHMPFCPEKTKNRKPLLLFTSRVQRSAPLKLTTQQCLLQHGAHCTVSIKYRCVIDRFTAPVEDATL